MKCQKIFVAVTTKILMSLDEDIKEGRYFASQQEQEILVASIEKYFSYPERSDQRAQIVSNITAQLQKISNRWNNRSVRLWFNNNKKSFLKSEPTVTFSQHISETAPMLQLSPINSQFVPPKKRAIPPRSSSVAQFAPPFAPPSPHPYPFQSASPISTIMNSPKNTIQEQKDLEVDLTQILAQSYNNHFLVNVYPIEQLHPIVAPQSLPESLQINGYGIQQPTRGYVENHIDNYPMLENGIANANGKTALVFFDPSNQQHVLKYNDQISNLDIHSSISSFYYNQPRDTFYIASGRQIHRISPSNPQLPPLTSTVHLYLSSCITSWHNYIILSSRRNISVYNDSSSNPTGFLITNLPNITSSTEACDLLCISSRNHHAIHCLDPNSDKLVSIFTGHAAAVTCLSNVGPSLLISGSADSTARIWDVRNKNQICQLMRHNGPLTFVNYDGGDDNIVLTGGEDGTVKGWDIRMNKSLFDVNCGTGIPIDASVNRESKDLTVITKQKTTTTAIGFKVPTTGDPQRSVANLEPNLCIRFVAK